MVRDIPRDLATTDSMASAGIANAVDVSKIVIFGLPLASERKFDPRKVVRLVASFQ